MCGRYIYDRFGRIVDITGETITRFPQASKYDERQLPLSYNAAPQQQHPIALVRDGVLVIQPARWGLPLPYQRRDPKARQLISARSDNIGRTFAGPLKKPGPEQGRCLVLANGFIEWRQGAVPKQPLLIRLKNSEAMLLAGMWMTLPDDPEQLGFAIITCEPSADMAGIHDRQPVILCAEQLEAWVDPASDPAEVSAMLTCLSEGELTAVGVSTRINSVRNNDVECLAECG